MALMVWKCVHGLAPAYLSDLLLPSQVISICNLQWLVLYWFHAPRLQLDNEVSQSTNQPCTWNRLPPALWSPDLSDSAFKQALKTHLFLTARRHLDVFMILVPDLLTYFTDMAVIAIWHTFNFSLIIQTGRMWLIWLTLFTSLRLSFWLSHSSLSYGLSASLDIQDWQTPLSMGGAVAVWVASRPEACRLSQLQGCGFESAPLTSIA